MNYLVYNEDGELIDVFNFDTSEELKIYQQDNPLYTVESTEKMDEHFLIEEDTIEEEGNDEWEG